MWDRQFLHDAFEAGHEACTHRRLPARGIEPEANDVGETCTRPCGALRRIAKSVGQLTCEVAGSELVGIFVAGDLACDVDITAARGHRNVVVGNGLEHALGVESATAMG